MGSSVQLAKKSRSQCVMLSWNIQDMKGLVPLLSEEELPGVEGIQGKDQNEGISLICLRN